MKNIENVKPDIIGSVGRAWKFDIQIYAAAHPELAVLTDLNVRRWIVEAAYAHPIWSHYAISCVSLRDKEGVPAPIIRLPGATHEILVTALDPSNPIFIDETLRMLTPCNFAGQFIAANDEKAGGLIDVAVIEVVNGILNPDTDFTWQWIERFGDSNLRK